MADINVPTTLNGLFKEIYADQIQNLVPDTAKIVKMVPFVQRDKEIGNKYHQPVILSWEHGVTYAAFNAGAFALNTSIALDMQDAQVSSSQMLLRSQISYDAAARASTSKKAFVKATEMLVENMMESMTKRVEVACLYGQSATGIGLGDSSANASATQTVVTFTTPTWATGIWVGMEGAKLNFYTYPGNVLVSTGADSVFTIVSVNVDNRTVTVNGTATGITALDSALAAAGQAYAVFNGAYGAEMAGLDKIITNTGTLFNIDAGTYNLWKGNSYGAGSAALTTGKLLSAVAKSANRGLDEKATVLLSPLTWSNLMNDLAAMRKFDASYDRRKLENGATAITFYSQNGELEIVSHSIVKEGEGFIFPTKRCKRIGATDITFKTPGMEDEQFFRQLENNAGYELRNYCDMAMFLETPAKATKITAIVNS